MKIEELKKLIYEAVKEAMRTELREILVEAVTIQEQQSKVSLTSGMVPRPQFPSPVAPVDFSQMGGNDKLPGATKSVFDILNETQASLTPAEMRAFKG